MEAKVFHLGKSGLEQAANKPNLPLYSRVYGFGAGMSDFIYAVISEPDERNSQKLCKIGRNYENQYLAPFATIDNYSRPLSKKFGIGLYWDDENPDFRFDEKEVKAAIESNNLYLKYQTEKQNAIQAENEKEIENLPKQNPHLTVNTKDDPKITKANLIADLKKHFPNIKFSVRKEHYSTYNISWADGPMTKEVDEIVMKYQDHHSDETGDFWDSDPSNFNRVFGGFTFVFTKRNWSGYAEAMFMDWANKMYECNNTFDSHSPENLAWILFSSCHVYPEFEIVKRDVTHGLNHSATFWEVKEINPKPVKMSKPAIDTSTSKNIQIVDYSEKAIAVIGETKPIKDLLQSIGGRFNFRLSCGAGWIFPKTKLNEVQKLLGIA